MRNASLRFAAMCALVIVLGLVIYSKKEREQSVLVLPLEPNTATTGARARQIQGDASEEWMPKPTLPAFAADNSQSNKSPLATATFAAKSVPFTELPNELRELLELAVTETLQGNYDNAALVALDAIELCDNYPSKCEYLHQLAGWNYEQAGSVDFAIEQYRLALAMNPSQRNAYSGLRRLDVVFSEGHPPLPPPLPTATRTGRSKPQKDL